MGKRLQGEEALACLTRWTNDLIDAGEAYYYRAMVYDKLGKTEKPSATGSKQQGSGSHLNVITSRPG